MELQHLKEHVDKRLDRLEDKLDSYVTESTRNSNDLTWVKGYIRISIGVLLSIVSYILSSIFGIHINLGGGK